MDDQVPDVGDPSECVGEDEDRIPFIEERVTEQQQGTQQTKPQKRGRHHHALEFLSGIPLDEEAGEEHGVAHPPDDFPDVPFNPKKLAVVPEQVGEPSHVEIETLDYEIQSFRKAHSASSFSTFS